MRKTVTYWLCVASVLLFSAFAGKMAALPADDAWQSVLPGSGETCQLAENDVPGEPGQPERTDAPELAAVVDNVRNASFCPDGATPDGGLSAGMPDALSSSCENASLRYLHKIGNKRIQDSHTTAQVRHDVFVLCRINI